MSQLSAEAEGKINVNQSMLEGSKTGKAAEADLMLLISKNPDIEGQDSNDPQRHIRLAKNKLTGWHGTVHVELDVETRKVFSMKIVLDVENTTTKRDGKLHLDPFEPDNSLTLVGVQDWLSDEKHCVCF